MIRVSRGGADVSELRIGVEELTDGVDVAGFDGGEDGLGCWTHVGRSALSILSGVGCDCLPWYNYDMRIKALLVLLIAAMVVTSGYFVLR
jgi:hypothetical protein